MAMDAVRDGDEVTVHFDLPGVDRDTIDITVEKNQLVVRAERRWSAYQRLRDSLSPEDRALLEMELRQEPAFSLRPLAGATSSGGMLGLTGSF